MYLGGIVVASLVPSKEHSVKEIMGSLRNHLMHKNISKHLDFILKTQSLGENKQFQHLVLIAMSIFKICFPSFVVFF